jgi:hypothetical protein
MDKYKTSYECLNKKEQHIMNDIYLLSSSGDFIEAVKTNNYN